jgi:trehalose 6-phosphate phosphatase
VIEIKRAGINKGSGIRTLMAQSPFKSRRPIFVGDDITDEPGFAAARELGGHGILVGAPRTTAADFRLPCPADLRDWLAEAVR